MGTVASFSPSIPRITCDRGRWYVGVPWDRAGLLHIHLGRRGFRTTLCLDPGDRVARLELWPGVDVDRVVTALDGIDPKKAEPVRGRVVASTEPLLRAAV